MSDFIERRQNVTSNECNLRHEPIAIHMVDTKTSIEKLHGKLNVIGLGIITNLATILGALIVFLVTRSHG